MINTPLQTQSGFLLILVDTVRPSSVQTADTVTLTRFPGRICPLWAMVNATDRGVSLKLERPLISNTLKKVRYLHHCEFLSKCLYHKVIPKGLTFNANINAPGLPSSRFLKRAKHASVCCIDHSPEWTDSTRKSRESYWIRRLNTLRPHGINKND